MTPKEEAKQIVDKFSPYVDYAECGLLSEREMIIKNSKQCALIHVEGILDVLKQEVVIIDEIGDYIGNGTQRGHYLEVKKEIQAI